MNSFLNRHIKEWLLKGDPSVRWQVLRDIVKAPQSEILAERKKIDKEGWGSRLRTEHGTCRTNTPEKLILIWKRPGNRAGGMH